LGFLQNAVPLRNFYAQRYDLKNKAENQGFKLINFLNLSFISNSLCGRSSFEKKTK
jgi:hypothetical protein